MSEQRARVDETTYAILLAVARACEALAIPWLVTGAAARFLLLERAYRLPPALATEDVDFGVMVVSWEQYRQLRDELCQNGLFRPNRKQRQRLDFEEGGYIDLIPFGGVESGGHSIEWPPGGDFVMRVLGFRDAYEDAVRVLVNDSLVVPVVSPEGLVLLKLFAWEDRHHAQPRKDARDIAYVLLHYETLLTVNALFGEHFAEVEASDYDLALAAARVLGKRISAIASPYALTELRDLLARELRMGVDSTLVREIGEYLALTEAERAYQLLKCVHMGLSDRGA